MSVEIITKEDLNEFRRLLIADLSTLLAIKPQQQKKWLKSNEVRKLLNISPGTLQNLRINGTLIYSRVGGIIFYESAHIDKLLNGNKTINREPRTEN